MKRKSANGESLLERDKPYFVKGWPLLGQLPALANDLIGSLRRFAERGDRPVEFKIVTSNAYLVSSPEGVKEVLTRGEPDFTKGILTSSMKAAFGDSLPSRLSRAMARHRQRRSLARASLALDQAAPQTSPFRTRLIRRRSLLTINASYQASS